MQCPTCDATNIPGAAHCDECQTNLMQEDLPAALPVTEFERELLGHTVGDLAPRAGVTIGEGASLGAAVSLLRDEHIGCVIVTGEQGRLAIQGAGARNVGGGGSHVSGHAVGLATHISGLR